MDEREARMALNSATEPGSAMITALLAEHSPAEVWHQLKAGRHGEPLARRAAAYDPTAAIALARRHRVRLIVPGDVEWPQQLDDLATCEPVQEMRGSPVALWVRGTATLAEAVGRSVAVVGSRAATSYGETTAAELAGGVSSLGISVVSGGAFGVDIAAHRGVLAARGITVAVMAGGLDALYPAANGPVLERVAQEGCLVSELPPGARPTLGEVSGPQSVDRGPVPRDGAGRGRRTQRGAEHDHLGERLPPGDDGGARTGAQCHLGDAPSTDPRS